MSRLYALDGEWLESERLFLKSVQSNIQMQTDEHDDQRMEESGARDGNIREDADDFLARSTLIQDWSFLSYLAQQQGRNEAAKLYAQHALACAHLPTVAKSKEWTKILKQIQVATNHATASASSTSPPRDSSPPTIGSVDYSSFLSPPSVTSLFTRLSRLDSSADSHPTTHLHPQNIAAFVETTSERHATAAAYVQMAKVIKQQDEQSEEVKIAENQADAIVRVDRKKNPTSLALRA